MKSKQAARVTTPLNRRLLYAYPSAYRYLHLAPFLFFPFPSSFLFFNTSTTNAASKAAKKDGERREMGHFALSRGL